LIETKSKPDDGSRLNDANKGRSSRADRKVRRYQNASPPQLTFRSFFRGALHGPHSSSS